MHGTYSAPEKSMGRVHLNDWNLNHRGRFFPDRCQGNFIYQSQSIFVWQEIDRCVSAVWIRFVLSISSFHLPHIIHLCIIHTEFEVSFSCFKVQRMHWALDILHFD